MTEHFIKKINKQSFCEYLINPLAADKFEEQYQHSFFRVLVQSQLHGSLAYKLGDDSLTGFCASFKRHLLSIKRFCEAQNRQAKNACALVRDTFSLESIPFIVLKGGAYVAGNKQNADGRLISDIDILVQKQDLNNIEALLLENGWAAKELDDYDDKYYREWSHELPPYTHYATGVTLDIHHTLIPDSANKKIDTQAIFDTAVMTEIGVKIPSTEFLVLHSAIHLLLNEDVEKGLRDCFDLHHLLLELCTNNKLERVQVIFEEANCKDEHTILMSLLHKLFDSASLPYTLHATHKYVDESLLQKSEDLFHAVFPNCEYLEDAQQTAARIRVYLRGHLSKMPFGLLLKHSSYKLYRTLAKKLLGEFVFRK